MITEDTYDFPNWDLDLELSEEEYHEVSTYDALNRPMGQEIGRIGLPTSVASYRYNARNLLFGITSSTPGHDDEVIVSSITYNSRGQRDSIVYGNGTETGYEYEPDTFRLKKVTTRKAIYGLTGP